PTKLTKTSGPRLPGMALVAEPKLEKGKEYTVAPANNVRPVPKFSRRAQLAQILPSKDNLHFKRNSANRLWALMMGRGLVHPVDFDHSANPPSHPDLLTMLAEEFAAMKFDVRAFLRELALSQTYQRSSEPPQGVQDLPADSFALATLKPLTPEQFAFSLLQSTGMADSFRLALAKKLTEPALYAQLAPSAAQVVNMFSSAAGEPAKDFEVTIDQTLFVTNGPTLRSWIAPRNGNLM